MIRLRSDQVLWQKERLLNLAFQALPDACRLVAWLDCDVIFEKDDWADRTRDALESHVLVQPYSRVYDLRQGADPDQLSPGDAFFERESMGWRIASGTLDPGRTSMNMLHDYSPGHGWAIRREGLERVGLYDAMILGSGDFVIAAAALGRGRDIALRYGMNERQADHYLRWSERFCEAVQGKVGVAEGNLYHLWHGSFDDRRYAERYPGIQPFNFDPGSDIALDGNGCWRWSSNKPDLHRYVKRYFSLRSEDGGRRRERGRWVPF